MIIYPTHEQYLRIQKGGLDHLYGAEWEEAYKDSLMIQFLSICPYLPKKCSRVLDVGSGLGGINILINNHYKAQNNELFVTLLDGENDPPKMTKHNKTFNNMSVAKDFLERNGVSQFGYYNAERVKQGFPPIRKYDLIISIHSWCFHYPPKEYLEFVKECCHESTVLIMDVRKDKPAYDDQLSVFQLKGIAHEQTKFQRRVYGCDNYSRWGIS